MQTVVAPSSLCRSKRANPSFQGNCAIKPRTAHELKRSAAFSYPIFHRRRQMMKINSRVAALFVACVTTLTSTVANSAEGKPTAQQIEQEAMRQQKLQALLPLVTISETQAVCAGPIPSGWIKVNDAWNPTVCGNPSNISYNVWTIERYDNKPVGSTMQACAAPVPSGWAIVGSNWNPTACGHPSSISNNRMTIKRLN